MSVSGGASHARPRNASQNCLNQISVNWTMTNTVRRTTVQDATSCFTLWLKRRRFISAHGSPGPLFLAVNEP